MITLFEADLKRRDLYNTSLQASAAPASTAAPTAPAASAGGGSVAANNVSVGSGNFFQSVTGPVNLVQISGRNGDDEKKKREDAFRASLARTKK